MEVRRIILPAIGAALLLSIVVLYIKVNGQSASASVDPEALKQAKNEHSRSARQLAAAAPPPTPERRTVLKPRPEPTPKPEPEPAPEPEKANTTGSSLRVMPNLRSQKFAAQHATDEQGGNELRDKLQSVRKAYDRGRYPEAREEALEVLEVHPANRRMLRVVVSASCIMFEPERAKEYYPKLPERDKRTMRKRCAKYGIDDLE